MGVISAPHHIFMRNKGAEFRKKASTALALLPVAIFSPRISLRNRARYCGLFIRIFRHSTWSRRALVLAAPVRALAAVFTWLRITLGIENHPVTRTHVYPGRQRNEAPVKKLKLFRARTMQVNGRVKHPEEAPTK